MHLPQIGPLKMEVRVEAWPLAEPFHITGYTFTTIDTICVYVEKDGCTGRGEAAGVYYKNDRPAGMLEQVERARSQIEAGGNWDSLQQTLGAGGARNAVDCALWDLQAKLSGVPVHATAGFDHPRPLLTTFTCPADRPEVMAEVACAFTHAKAIKLKLTGEPIDADRVRAVREVRKDVWLGIDANQGFNRAFLEGLMPVLTEARVDLIEQPFPLEADSLLDGFESPIPIAADESVQTRREIPSLAGRFNVVNIKLDKCGGLTEGLAMARMARELGMSTMVGNMLGSSLAMAPAYILGQMCSVVDLDGPIFITADRDFAVRYEEGHISCPEALWGYPTRVAK
jgi:L-alanine-DL-glutamate epimerase-like enolase superfamily enzyme